MKVLIIPSYYPSSADPCFGSYVLEQARLLSEYADVRVLFGRGRLVGYRTAWRDQRYVPRPRSARLIGNSSFYAIAPPPASSFEYAHRSVNDADSCAASLHAYQQAFGHLLATGWVPDLLHAHGSEVAGIVCHHLSKKFGIPWMLTEHSSFSLAKFSIERQALIFAALVRATRVAAVSRHQMQGMILHGIHRPIDVVGNLVDENLFSPGNDVSSDDLFRILAIIYPVNLKDAGTFFCSLAILRQHARFRFKATVIGNAAFGNLKKATTTEFADLAKKHSVADLCSIRPFASREDMARETSGCDVVVSTSIAESFGLSIRECLCAGKPAVCTRSGGVDEDITAENGFLVPIKSPDAVAEGLLAVQANRNRYNPASIRESIIVKYGRKAFSQRMLALYESVAQTPVVLESGCPKLPRWTDPMQVMDF